MSSFIDLLNKVGERAPSPMGFGASKRDDQGPPTIALIGRITSSALEADPELANADVDALLVDIGKATKKAIGMVSKATGERLWGVRANGLTDEQLAQLKEAGCDFIILEPANSAASILDDEDIGKFIPVDADLEEGVARAMHDLPIDGAVFGVEEMLPLTVQKLIDLQLIRGLVAGPFLVTVPLEIGRGDLISLRTADVNGLVLDLTSSDGIATLREAIADLPRRRSGPSNSATALVPQYTAGFATPHHDHDDGADDGDIDDDF